METYAFIFSNQPKYRIQRHTFFWTFWWLFMSFLYTFAPSTSHLNYLQRLPNSAMDSLLYLVSHLFLSYTLMYFVIPKYIVKAKYTAAAFWSIALMLVTGVIAAVTTLYLIYPVKEAVLPNSLIVRPPVIKANDNTYFYFALIAGLRGGLSIGGIAAAIKLMKYWYIKEQTNLQLQKENTEAQLQVLKAQVHPHFLFNTLNNIYSFTQNSSPVAAQMICGLSDMLRYMLYECDQPLVPLSKELKLVKEYIDLEKIRYGNQLELYVSVPSDTRNLTIAPLMLLPFIENCFKHGTCNVLEQPWIHFSIVLTGAEMTMKLMNSKAAKTGEHIPGIGITNIEKRLKILYPEKHQLLITEEEDVFIVLLKLQLEEKQITQSKNKIVLTAFAH